MANRIAIFIDGAYLYRVLQDEFNGARIDFGALAKALAKESDLLRTYYYNCPLYQSDSPTEEQQRQYESQYNFFETLESLPRYTVRLGRLAYRGTSIEGRPIFEQKGIDMLLGMDLIQLATKHAIQEAVVLTGDADFVPALRAAKAEGVLIRLYHGIRPRDDLWREADERVQITDSLVDAVPYIPRFAEE